MTCSTAGLVSSLRERDTLSRISDRPSSHLHNSALSNARKLSMGKIIIHECSSHASGRVERPKGLTFDTVQIIFFLFHPHHVPRLSLEERLFVRSCYRGVCATRVGGLCCVPGWLGVGE